MTTEVKEQISTKIQTKHTNGTYTLTMQWDLRMASLEVHCYLPTEFFLSDLTLEDIEKIAYDLLKIIEKERK